MIKKYTLNALQKAINQILLFDETRPERIRALHGKVIKIVIAPLNVHFFIHFADYEIQLLADYEGSVDTTILSSPLGLIRLSLLPASKVRSLFNDQITIIGDTELGREVKKLFDEIDIDWEGHLAQFTGDVVAHQLGSFVRRGLAFKNQVSKSMQQNLIEYLQEELRLFPPREEIEDFFADVDELALQVERLAAHINQLTVNDEIF